MSKTPEYKVFGNRVLIRLPKRENSKIEVDHNTKEALEKELAIKHGSVEVVSVGETVTYLEVGDFVMVEPSALTKALAIPALCTDDFIIGLISPFDIILRWVKK